MRLDSTREQVERILADESLGRDDKITALRKLYALVRGELRAASESAMVDADDLGAMQILLEKAFERLGTRAPAPEDRGAATL